MAKPIGNITRGTTNPNRLRRVDRWMLWRYQDLLRKNPSALIVDLGFGAKSVTTLEMASRFHENFPSLCFTGLEIDPDRVKLATETSKPLVNFQLGGFEIPTPERPMLVRAFNVLRQYDEPEVRKHWATMQSRLDENGRLIEGTCDEIGRRATWIELDRREPLTLSLGFRLQGLDDPVEVAERLPKILIHRNTPGNAIHTFLQDLSKSWNSHSGYRVFGPQQRWRATVNSLRGSWPIVNKVNREGELTIEWSAVSPD